MEHEQIFEFGRSSENRESNGQETGEFGDANGFDDVGVFGCVDARSDESERKTKSRRRLKLVNAATKNLSVGLEKNFAGRCGNRVREFRDFRIIEGFGAANPCHRRDGCDRRKRIGFARGERGKLQNQRLAVACARDTGGDSKLEV